MNIPERINDLRKRIDRAKAGGGEKAVAKQHSDNKSTARERIERLLDPCTFMEMDIFVAHRCTNFNMSTKEIPAEAVVTGYGKIDQRPVYIFAQDFTTVGGTLGEMHAEKICKLLDMAMKTGAPVIGLLDSGGARIQEGVDAMKGYGSVFYRNTLASGVIPQISSILGSCAGGASYSPALTDYIFMVRGMSKMFITGPEVVKAVTGEIIGVEELGGAMTHNQISGVAHFAVDDEEECFMMIRKLLSYIPSSCRERPPYIDTYDSIDRQAVSLDTIVQERPEGSYDMLKVIKEIVDGHDFFQIMPYYAPNIIIGFARINGHSVGIVANQPMVKSGYLDIDASDKAARHIRFCDAFNIPLVSLADCPGYLPDLKQEVSGLIRHFSKVIYAYAEATVPKITVITGKAYENGFLTMCPHGLGADQVIAWPTAEIGLAQQNSGPYDAAARGIVDMVIEPKYTRRVLSNVLEDLISKAAVRPPRKHGNIQL